MVKVGDKIETEDGFQGIVTHIMKGADDRYLIFFKERRHPHYFIEGDKKYRILKEKDE